MPQLASVRGELRARRAASLCVSAHRVIRPASATPGAAWSIDQADSGRREAVRGRIDAFELSGRLPLVFIIPKEVADEIETGARAGYAVAVPKLATILSLKDAIVPLGPHLLDAGEATAIQLGY